MTLILLLHLVAVRQRHLCFIPVQTLGEVFVPVKEVDLHTGRHNVRVHLQEFNQCPRPAVAYAYYDCLVAAGMKEKMQEVKIP